MVQRALLVIADIGGYTKFMRVHRVNLAHAQYAIAQLLEAVIDGAGSRLKLAKLEGDAAFFYALAPEGQVTDVVATLSALVGGIRQAFVARRNELENDRVCPCESCKQAGQLKLKFVAHVGEVAFQKVKRHTELAGVDVILVHRLLKNTVPVAEYMLMSEPVFEHIEEAVKSFGCAATEELDGLGTITTYYVDLEEMAPWLPRTLESSAWRKVSAWLTMTRRSIPFFFGLKEPCRDFRNMDGIARTQAPRGVETRRDTPRHAEP